MSGSPEELLRSALEKVIFFECRVASLEHELEAARASAARARDEGGAARRREGELEAQLAQLKGTHATAAAHNAELTERVRLLEAERERFLSGMVESARVAGAPADEDEESGSATELAGFIAELRAEIEVLRAFKREAEAAGYAPAPASTPTVVVATPTLAAPPSLTANASSLPDHLPAARGEGARTLAAPVSLSASAGVRAASPTPVSLPATAGVRAPPPATSSLPAMASAFEQSGRITVSAAEARTLPRFTTRSERALYESCLDDLAASDPSARRRAADGLRALGSRDAAPLVAAALGRETDPEVKAALLAALGALGEANASALAFRELADARPPVRAAALEAVSALAGAAAVPALSGALGDASPLVRRRAVVLLGFARGEAADDALAAALSDRDAGVARAAAAALAGRPSARAQGALARALDHREAAVRRAAALATARWSGEAVDTGAPDAERRRAARRIGEKLLEVGSEALRSAVTKVPAGAAPPSPRPSPAAVRTAAALTVRGPTVRTAALTVGVPTAGATVGATVGASTARRAGACPPPARQRQVPGGARLTPAAAVQRAVAVAAPDASLAGAALGEIRTALRGRTAEELAMTLGSERLAIEATLRALVAQGQLVARGPRFFMS